MAERVEGKAIVAGNAYKGNWRGMMGQIKKELREHQSQLADADVE